jgi:hypothetical protein
VSTVHVLDHVETAVGRLTDVYRKPLISALLSAAIREVQKLEDTYWDLYTKRSPATGEGNVLDLLGRIVGQLREGRSDDEYRIWIAARILVNQSSGTRPQLIAIVRKLVGAGVDMRFEDEYPAAFTIHIEEPIVGADGVEIAKMVKLARAGGVAGQFHWYDIEAVFRFSATGDAPELDSDHGFNSGRFSAVSDGRDMDFEPPDLGGDDGGELLVVL